MVGGDPGLEDDLVVLQSADDNIAVADVNGKEHERSPQNLCVFPALPPAGTGAQEKGAFQQIPASKGGNLSDMDGTGPGHAGMARTRFICSRALPMAVTSTAAAMASGTPLAATMAMTAPITASMAMFLAAANSGLRRR